MTVQRTVLSLLLCVGAAAASQHSAAMESWFSRLDSSLVGLAAEPDVQAGTAAAVEKRLKAALGGNSVVASLVRVSTKGKVVAEVSRDGAVGDKNRSLAKQDWFTAVAVKMQPHYGSLRQAKGPLLLLWVKPVSVQAKGKAKPAGALMAKVDLKECFASLAPAAGVSFAVAAGSEELLRHNWQEGGAVQEEPLAVKGIEGLVLRWQAPPPPPPAAVDTPATVAPPAGGSMASTKVPGTVVVKLVVGLAVALVVLVVVVLLLVGQASRKRREATARDRMRRDAAAAAGRRPPPTASLAALSPPPTASYAAPQPAASARAAAHAPAATPAAGMATPAAHAPPAGTPPPAAPGSGFHLAPEVLAKVRQQVADEVRAQLQDELEAERRKFTARAEVFTRTVDTHIKELVEKFGESEAKWAEVSAAMKNSAIKLQQALQGFAQRTPGQQ